MKNIIFSLSIFCLSQTAFSISYNVNQMSPKGIDIMELMKVNIRSLDDLGPLLGVSSPLYQIISSLNPIDASIDLYVGPDHWSAYADAMKQSLNGNLKKTMCKSLQKNSLPIYTRPKDFNEADKKFIGNLYKKTCG